MSENFQDWEIDKVNLGSNQIIFLYSGPLLFETHLFDQ